MPDTPDYLVTARSVNPLAQFVDSPEPLPVRRDPSPFIVRSSPLRTPVSYRRAWFDYVREAGNDRS